MATERTQALEAGRDVALPLAVALLGARVLAAAQERPDEAPPSIQVTGVGAVMVWPDQADVDLSVTSQAKRSTTAAQQNAQRVAGVLTRLREVTPSGAIRSASYTLHPAYRHSDNGGKPTITGYEATNIVRVTVYELGNVARVIDAATAGGTCRVLAVRFSLKDEQLARARALGKATVHAKAQAEAFAMALGVRTGRVLAASERSAPVVPLQGVAFAGAEVARTSTPLELSPVEIQSSVSLTVEICAS